MLDTNVMLDVLLRRDPFVSEAKGLLLELARLGSSPLFCATSVTDVWYVARKQEGIQHAREALGIVMSTLEIVGVGAPELVAAHTSGSSDFEDAVVMACALSARADAIVTRDGTGFEGSPVPVWSPAEALERLRQRE